MSLPNKNLPFIILSNPTRPQNIGSIARIMKNYDIEKLIFYGDKKELLCLIESTDAQKTARKAKDILDNAIFFNSLDDIKESMKELYIIGTISPKRSGGDFNPKRVSLYLGEIPNQIYSMDNIALLFGTESAGLNNSEIELCDMLVSIPTSKNYYAMNLSHAIAVVIHHFYSNMFESSHPKHRPALKEEQERLLNIIRELSEIYNPERAQNVYKCFENVILRSVITGREAYTLMGVFKKTRKILETENLKLKK